jgi:diguanylate cyclase (GGDEF)-like protein
VTLIRLETLSSGVVRGLAAAIAVPYLTAITLAPHLPPVATWTAAVVVLAALVFAWLRVGRPRTGGWIAALGLPLHLVLIPSGGLGSPLLPLLFPWLLLLTWIWPRRRIAVVSLAVLAWLVLIQLWNGGVEVAELLEAVLVCAGGILPAWTLDTYRRLHLPPGGAMGRLLGDPAHATHDDAATSANRRFDELVAALDRARRSLGAWRAVLWEIDIDRDRAWPRLVSGGDWPPAVSLTGDPLRLAREDNLVLRLETPPRWATGSSRACIVPLARPGEYDVILTVEYDADGLFPAAQHLEETAAQLRAFLDMQREAARASAAREHFGKIIALLRRIPQQMEPAEFAAELAEAMREFTGMSGAAVARWDQDVGHLLACVGDDGGMPPGATFGVHESEMALAAASITTLVRQREHSERDALPVIAPGERWLAEPRTILVVPLHGSTSGLVGVLAVWDSQPAAVKTEQVAIVELLAPYAAMQMQQIHAYGPLQKLADHDALTGLYNRRVFDERMQREEEHFLRYRRPTSLLILDVDHFKRINDTFGHAAGDAVLKALASLLRSALRGADLVARLGGEEFVILLPETALAGAIEIAQRLRRQVETMVVEWQDTPIDVRVSVGVAACPECTASPGTLLNAADAALYASKHAGRNQVTAAPYAIASGENG